MKIRMTLMAYSHRDAMEMGHYWLAYYVEGLYFGIRSVPVPIPIPIQLKLCVLKP